MDGRKVRHTCERQGIRNGRNAHCQNRLDACRTRTRFFRLKAHPEGCTCGCADNRQIVRLSAITADDSLEDLYKHYSNGFRKAVDSVFGDEYPEMADQLRANVSRFSAYKANYVRQAFDDNARQFSGKDLDDANRATINQFRRWTDAELTTAGARARTAKQFTEFNEPDRRELFPSLKWLPSRAVNPRQSHAMFWGGVWRKDDDFWKRHQPGTEWNCMCDLEECDDAPQEPKDYSRENEPEVPKGFEPEPYGDKGQDQESNNPYHTGKVFNDNVGYIAKASADTWEKTKPTIRDIIREQHENYTKIYTTSIGDVLVDDITMIEVSKGSATDVSYFLKQEIAKDIRTYVSKMDLIDPEEKVDLGHNNKKSIFYKRKLKFECFKVYSLSIKANNETYSYILKFGKYKDSENLHLYSING
ncbi:MAG: hypothetical protein IKO90_09085 [Bacteroidales bacterium]|nr:hypothetical protein [Bacteroidales bacterium]